jgi:hypothetical protein
MHGADLAIYKSNGLTDELRILCWQLRSETVISVDHDIEKENIYMKLLVRAFEQLSCLKINFRKNELFCFGQAKQQEKQHIQVCLVVSWVHIPFATSVFQCTIKSLLMMIGRK